MELFEPILHFFEQRWVHNIIWAVILVIVTAIAAKVASKTLRHLLNRDDNPLPASSIFINIARAVIWMIGGSFILDNCFGINANALVAALGVGGIAISLGFQDTLSNLIGGMQVTFMGIIKPGDNIEVGGVSGVVQDITWRHTTIEDACGQTIIVPNSNISKNTLVHLMPFGRVVVPVAVKDTSKWDSLDALADELACATKVAVSPISGFDKEPYVLFSEIGDFGIKGKIIFIVSDDSTTFTAADACIRAIAPDHRLKPPQRGQAPLWWCKGVRLLCATKRSGAPDRIDRVPRFFISRVDSRGEQLLLRAVVALTTTDEMRHTNAQHRATSNPSKRHAVKTGQREVGALLILDGKGDGTAVGRRGNHSGITTLRDYLQRIRIFVSVERLPSSLPRPSAVMVKVKSASVL
mgnify:CR=1 FL=1